MKTILLSFALVMLMAYNVVSQDFSELDSIQLADYEQYKAAEPKVLACCDYLLSTPFDKKDTSRVQASQFLLKWMEGTPEYTFNIDETASSLTDGKVELLQLYLAAMTKVHLTTKDGRVTEDEMKEKAVDAFVDYCANTDNEVKLTKELKKVVKERSDLDS